MNSQEHSKSPVKPLRALFEDDPTVHIVGATDVPVSGLVTDSRKVRPGDLFIALSGSHTDGHRFVEDAVSRGACAVMVERLPEVALSVPVVVAHNARKAMAAAAAAFFDHPVRRLVLVGITGTNGKTSTSLLVESILSHAGFRVGVIGTLGYRWGGVKEKADMTTPDAADLQRIFFRMVRDGVSHVVMEVSSHALELCRVDGVFYDVGVFTNLSQDHLDFHGSMEAYFAAKRRLFAEHMKGRPPRPRALVFNSDDPYGARLARDFQNAACTYAVDDPGASVRPRRWQLGAQGIEALVETPSGPVSVTSPLMGRLNLYNILAAIGAVQALGIPREAVESGIGAVTTVDGRLQRLDNDCGLEVIVDFAHTPDAMEKALECLRELTPGRLWVVFGCGGDRDRTKRPVMGSVAGRYGDVVVITSDNPRTERPEAIVREIEPGVQSTGKVRFSFQDPAIPRTGYTVEVDRRKAIESAIQWAEPGDLVFIGGKGHETYQIVGTDVRPFDDRVVAREALARRKGMARPGCAAGGRA